MVVMASVEVQCGTFAACKYDIYVETVCKSSLIIHTAPYSVVSMSKVGNQKARTANLCNDLIFNLVYMFLAVYRQGSKASVSNASFNTILLSLSHTVVKPHSNERLGGIYDCLLFGDSIVTVYGNLASKYTSRRLSLQPTHLRQVLQEIVNLFPTERFRPGIRLMAFYCDTDTTGH